MFIPESQVLQIPHFFIQSNDFRQKIDFEFQDCASFAGASTDWLYSEDTSRNSKVTLLHLKNNTKHWNQNYNMDNANNILWSSRPLLSARRKPVLRMYWWAWFYKMPQRTHLTGPVIKDFLSIEFQAEAIAICLQFLTLNVVLPAFTWRNKINFVLNGV